MVRRRFVTRRTFPVHDSGSLRTLGDIVAVPFLFPLSRALRAVQDEVLEVGSGPAACSYKVLVVLVQATDPSATIPLLITASGKRTESMMTTCRARSLSQGAAADVPLLH